jgi:hypothetical protein
MRYFSGLFFLLFILFAIVQYNDPDAWLWILIYFFCAAASAMVFFGRYHLPALLIGSLGFLVYAIVLFPGDTRGWVEAEQINRALTMHLPFVEEARESFGLMLSAAVFSVYFIVGLRKKRKPTQRI